MTAMAVSSSDWSAKSRMLVSSIRPLESQLVRAEIHVRFPAEPLGYVIDQEIVDVVSAQERVTARGDHPKHALADLQNRDVKRPAPEIEHRDSLVVLLVETVRDRRGRGFIDDPEYVQTGHDTRVLCRLPLSVVEVSGYGDHRVLHGLAQVVLRHPSHLRQHE